MVLRPHVTVGLPFSMDRSFQRDGAVGMRTLGVPDGAGTRQETESYAGFIRITYSARRSEERVLADRHASATFEKPVSRLD